MALIARTKLMGLAKSATTSSLSAQILFKKTEHALSLYEASSTPLAKTGVRSPKGVLLPNYAIGVKIVNRARQRRAINILARKQKRGQPRKDEVRMLVSFIAAAYFRATGKPVTISREDLPGVTDFECYCTQILDLLGISDSRGWLVKHMKARRDA